MFNNIVLDVFIGLVLIYLLYSLFITIVSEMIVTWMALRSRILRVAIEKMLNDGYHNKLTLKKDFLKRTLSFIPRYFLKEFEDFKYSLAGKFYNNPSIKYLSDNGGEKKFFFSQTKPSYISADMFAETLTWLLKDKGNGTTDMGKVNFCLKFNTHHIEPATLKHLRDVAENSADDINVLKDKFKAWYNETMDRATGWYKRKLQLILFWLGLMIAISFNVDSIRIAKILSRDKDARSQLVSMGIELSKDSARYKDFLAGSDTVHSKAILDSGYARISKDMNDANMILGLGWSFAGLMKNDKTCFNREKDSASFSLLKEYQIIFNGFSSTFNGLQNKIQADKKYRDSLLDKVETYKRDTAVFRLKKIFAPDPVKRALDDTLKKTIPMIDSTVNRLSIAETMKKVDSAELRMLIQSKKEATRQVNTYTSMKFVLIDSIINDTVNKNERIVVYARRPYSTLEKTGYILSKFNPFNSGFWSFIFSLQFLGIFITALMLSLGAPFWFDLLKKLVAIRGSGVKPEEKKSEDDNKPDVILAVTPVAPPVIPNVTPAVISPIMAAVQIAVTATQHVSGIFSVEKGFISQNNKKSEAIEVQCLDNNSINNAKQILGQVFQNYPVKYIVNSRGKVHGLNRGQTILNETKVNGLGTLGCFVKKEGSKGQYIMSCWHVLKEDRNWLHMENNSTIMDSDEKKIARLVDGCLTNKLDIGFAELLFTENTNQQFKFNWREINTADVFNDTEVNFIGATSGNKSAIIYDDGKEKWLSYPDKISRKLEDLLVITSFDENDEHISPSAEGDSGAIVLDKDGFPLGLVVGGDDVYTYVIKFSNILSEESIYKEYKLLI